MRKTYLSTGAGFGFNNDIGVQVEAEEIFVIFFSGEVSNPQKCNFINNQIFLIHILYGDFYWDDPFIDLNIKFDK